MSPSVRISIGAPLALASASTSSRNISRTGYVNPGTWSVGAPSKYPANFSASSVADMRTSFRSGRSRIRFRRTTRRKSSFMPRSWISSTKTWLTERNSESSANRRSRVPVVQKVSRVASDRRASSLIWYPTLSPSASPRSCATRAATLTAETLRGCVHTTFVVDASPAASARSRTNRGSCVVFPHPVSPETTRTCVPSSARKNASFAACAGSRARAASRRRAEGVETRRRSRSRSSASVAAHRANADAASLLPDSSLFFPTEDPPRDAVRGGGPAAEGCGSNGPASRRPRAEAEAEASFASASFASASFASASTRANHRSTASAASAETGATSRSARLRPSRSAR